MHDEILAVARLVMAAMESAVLMRELRVWEVCVSPKITTSTRIWEEEKTVFDLDGRSYTITHTHTRWRNKIE